MTELFISVLNLTLAGSAAALIVLVLQIVLRRISGIYSYILWILVFFRFLSPFSVETAFSLFPVNRNAVTSGIYEMVPAVDTGISAVDEVIDSALMTAAASNPAGSVSPVQIAFAIAALVWAAGAAVIAGVQLRKLARFLLRIRTGVALKGEEGVKVSEWIEVPAVAGLWKPVIVLPCGIPEEDRKYILAHERVHIARKDYLIQAVCFAAAVIHWFNPLVWISYGNLCREMESSCDERAVRNMDMQKRRAYGMALLRFAGKRSGLQITPAFGKSRTKERVERVLRSRRPAAWAAAAAGLCTILAGCGLITSPKPDVSSAAVSVIGGADGPTSIFLAGKGDEADEPIPFAGAAWDESSGAEGVMLDLADPGIPEEGSLAVFHAPAGVFVFRGTGEDMRAAVSVDMAGVDELYGRLYGEERGTLRFEARGGGGNALILGFSQDGTWLEDHVYLLDLDREELFRPENGPALAAAWDSLSDQAYKQAAGSPDSEAGKNSRLISESGFLRDLTLEVEEDGKVLRYPLFP